MAERLIGVPILMLSEDEGHSSAALDLLSNARPLPADATVVLQPVSSKQAQGVDWLVLTMDRTGEGGDSPPDTAQRYLRLKRPHGVLVLEFFGRHLSGSRVRLGRGSDITKEAGRFGIQNSAGRFIAAMLEQVQAESTTWMEATERLLHYLGRLLDERAILEHQLALALRDRDVAEARAREIEAMYEALRAERYETKDQLDKTFLVLCATAIFTLLGPIAQPFVDHALRDDVDGARGAAVEVTQECQPTTNITINLPVIDGGEAR